MQEHSLKKRYSIKLLANIVAGVINAVLVAIVPKALGPLAYGQFVYLQDFFMKFIGFLDMGSSTAFFTKLSANRKRKELMVFYLLYASVVLLILFITMILVIHFNLAELLLPNIPKKYVFFGLFFGFFTWLVQIFIKISDAYAITVSVELIKIIQKVLSLILLIGLIKLTAFDLKSYYYFQYIVLTSFIILLAWLFFKKDIFVNLQFLTFVSKFYSLIREFVSYCHPLLVYSIIGLVAGFFDIWLLQKVAGSEQTGFYGLAYSLAAMCFLFTSAMTPIITREFSKSYEQKDLKTMRKLFFRYVPMLYSVAAYFAVFVSMQSENILTIFTDANFKDTYWVLVVMALYPIHQTYGQLSGSIFYATGQTKLMRNIALFTQPLGILISFLFIYICDFAALGLALKMILVQFIGVNIQLFFNAKLLKFDMIYFLRHQLYSIVFFSIFAYLASSIFFFKSSLLEFFFSGVLYTFLVTVSVYFFPYIFATSRDEIRNILHRGYK